MIIDLEIRSAHVMQDYYSLLSKNDHKEHSFWNS